MGTARIAGIIGAVQGLRALGERLLVLDEVRTPLIHIGVPYVTGTLDGVFEQVTKVGESLKSDPQRLASVCGPTIIGVLGRGLVGQGAIEVLEKLGAQKIEPDAMLTPESLDFNGIFYCVLSRSHFLEKKDGS